jgi:peptidyl-prolyl cis-trans isomerase SurA
MARLQRAKIESSISVGDEEVKAVLDRMTAAKGTQEFRVGEIYLPAASGNEQQALANANQILQQLRNGASFAGYAGNIPKRRRRRSAATSAGSGPSSFPSRCRAHPHMAPGQVSIRFRCRAASRSSPFRTRARF